MLEIDRYALSRASQLQTDILAHYTVYEFHPVVSKLQIYCSEDLGSFYLDILKDRLYTSGAKSLARRSAQTALHQITHAMLRWMAPFLSFTAEEAWKEFGSSESIFLETYRDFAAPNDMLLNKWARIRAIRSGINKQLETLRQEGHIGSSLQAEVRILAENNDLEILQTLGDDLRFVFITSSAMVDSTEWRIPDGESMNWYVANDSIASYRARVSKGTKCERCWHYCDDVGGDPDHPTICGRCISNLYGAGESRKFA